MERWSGDLKASRVGSFWLGIKTSWGFSTQGTVKELEMISEDLVMSDISHVSSLSLNLGLSMLYLRTTEDNSFWPWSRQVCVCVCVGRYSRRTQEGVERSKGGEVCIGVRSLADWYRAECCIIIQNSKTRATSLLERHRSQGGEKSILCYQAKRRPKKDFSTSQNRRGTSSPRNL